MYYYKTKTWFAPMNTVVRFSICEDSIKVYFKNGTWESISETLELLDDSGKVENTYDCCNVKVYIESRFEAIIADYIQLTNLRGSINHVFKSLEFSQSV